MGAGLSITTRYVIGGAIIGFAIFLYRGEPTDNAARLTGEIIGSMLIPMLIGYVLALRAKGRGKT